MVAILARWSPGSKDAALSQGENDGDKIEHTVSISRGYPRRATFWRDQSHVCWNLEEGRLHWYGVAEIAYILGGPAWQYSWTNAIRAVHSRPASLWRIDNGHIHRRHGHTGSACEPHLRLADITSISHHSRAGVSKLFEARATLGNSALPTGGIKWEMNNSM
jgi:hypothetical protein